MQNKRNKIEKIKELEEGVKNLGGLGSPHVGSAEWTNKRELYNRMKQFGNQQTAINRKILKNNNTISASVSPNQQHQKLSSSKNETGSIGRIDT